MKVKITYRDRIHDNSYKVEEIEVGEYGYFIGPGAYFEPIICDEDVEVEANSVKIVKIREIHIPGNGILSLLDRFRHALGFLIAVVEEGKFKRLESPQKISHVVFLPVENGSIRRGELLGVGCVRIMVEKPKSVLVEKLQEFDRTVSIDPEVFIKSDWPYLWKRRD
ncbi:hypothetical protein DRP07_01120 [Archaeoglobales archaeon]|nr:MAG: hypothetical protein DRP07_01120 [Archaeoglobales archaeon]